MIGAESIPRILVFNKSDLIDQNGKQALCARYPHCILVSAQERYGLDELIKAISQAAAARGRAMEVLIPYEKGNLISLAHERCHIISKSHEAEGTKLSMVVDRFYEKLFEAYQI